MCRLGLEEHQDGAKMCRLVSCTQGQGTSRELERRSDSSSASEAGSRYRGASARQSEVLGSSVVFLLHSPVPVNMDSTVSCSSGSGLEEQPGLGTLGVSALQSSRGLIHLLFSLLLWLKGQEGERGRGTAWGTTGSESRAFLKSPAWKPNKNI